jgi:hypothetical protein
VNQVKVGSYMNLAPRGNVSQSRRAQITHASPLHFRWVVVEESTEDVTHNNRRAHTRLIGKWSPSTGFRVSIGRKVDSVFAASENDCRVVDIRNHLV